MCAPCRSDFGDAPTRRRAGDAAMASPAASHGAPLGTVSGAGRALGALRGGEARTGKGSLGTLRPVSARR